MKILRVLLVILVVLFFFGCQTEDKSTDPPNTSASVQQTSGWDSIRENTYEEILNNAEDQYERFQIYHRLPDGHQLKERAFNEICAQAKEDLKKAKNVRDLMLIYELIPVNNELRIDILQMIKKRFNHDAFGGENSQFQRWEICDLYAVYLHKLGPNFETFLAKMLLNETLQENRIKIYRIASSGGFKELKLRAIREYMENANTQEERWDAYNMVRYENETIRKEVLEHISQYATTNEERWRIIDETK